MPSPRKYCCVFLSTASPAGLATFDDCSDFCVIREQRFACNQVGEILRCLRLQRRHNPGALQRSRDGRGSGLPRALLRPGFDKPAMTEPPAHACCLGGQDLVAALWRLSAHKTIAFEHLEVARWPLCTPYDEIMIVAFAGGVGGAKLARGLYLTLPPTELLIAVNTGDDFEHLGLWPSRSEQSLVAPVALRDTFGRLSNSHSWRPRSQPPFCAARKRGISPSTGWFGSRSRCPGASSGACSASPTADNTSKKRSEKWTCGAKPRPPA
jgi:hypothetical protein